MPAINIATTPITNLILSTTNTPIHSPFDTCSYITKTPRFVSILFCFISLSSLNSFLAFKLVGSVFVVFNFYLIRNRTIALYKSVVYIIIIIYYYLIVLYMWRFKQCNMSFECNIYHVGLKLGVYNKIHEYSLLNFSRLTNTETRLRIILFH